MSESLPSLRRRPARDGPGRIPAALLVCGVLASCAGPAPKEPPPLALVEQGREVYAQNCALCHGPDGAGDGAWQSELMTPAADLTRIAARRDGRFPAGEVARLIDGRIPVEAHLLPEMPVWGDVISVEVSDPGAREEVTRGKLSALVAFLASIQTQPASGSGAASPSNPPSGPSPQLLSRLVF